MLECLYKVLQDCNTEYFSEIKIDFNKSRCYLIFNPQTEWGERNKIRNKIQLESAISIASFDTNNNLIIRTQNV